MITDTRFGSRSINKWMFVLNRTVVICFLLVGCGGRDGDTSRGLTYSGAADQAVISSDNAQTLAANAMDAGSGGAGISGISGLDAADQGEDGKGRPLFMGLAMVVESAVAEMDQQSDADTYPGGCGGSYSFNIQVDSVTGVFSGTLAFNGYCESDIVLNGSTRFSGIINLSLHQVESCTVSFNSITGLSGSESVAMGGEVYLAVSGATTMITMDMMVRDNSDGRVCKIENFQMDITDWGMYAEITPNGRYYDPDYGYVDLETTVAFMISDAGEYPHTGQLVLSGENGTAGGPTKARLTALSATECQVEADTDGDGNYDYDSGAVLWTEL